ncbi:hypothetical protein V2J09_001640 [Rumex salicifolius]
MPPMAAIGFNSSQSFRRIPVLFCLAKVRFRPSSSISSVESLPRAKDNLQATSYASTDDEGGTPEASVWKKLNSKDLGISTSMIAKPTRVVLKTLKKQGYEVYLVGGCVRDLILKRIPKDFDVITSAQLREVVRSFPRCVIVGRRFPICHVHVDDTVIEVSSFSTVGRNSSKYLKSFSAKAPHCSKLDYIRWKNCLQRDFTINGLLYDPFSKVIYDYIGGIEDIRRTKVRTVIPAQSSFTEDSVRLAARLGFRFTKEIAHSLKELSCSVLRLDKARILMELNYMLAFGSAEASLRLLWKFGLLEILLPVQAAYFVSQGFKRRDKRSNMLLLLTLLSSLFIPHAAALYYRVSILAFHKALADHPQDPLVVATFCLALYNDGSISEAVHIARSISRPCDTSFHELLESPEVFMSQKNVAEKVIGLAESFNCALNKLSDRRFVSQAMAKYPQAPFSDMVFISNTLQMRVSDIVDCMTRKEKKIKRGQGKQGRQIKYDLLAEGNVHQVRYILARDALYRFNV